MMRIIVGIIIVTLSGLAIDRNCKLPNKLSELEKPLSFEKLLRYNDVQRNTKKLENLCVHLLSFNEKKYHWKMLLVTNPKKSTGFFWFLPHDDENSAFDSAVYATEKYGGGFLSVISNDKRYFMGQDPNRNFGTDSHTAKICKKQHYPAPLYSKYIFEIIDSYKKPNMPYLALHNNKNGWYGNGGAGGVSILKNSKTVKSYLSGKVLTGKFKGMKDEDNLVYIAGKKKYPNRSKLDALLSDGLHVKYEIVNERSNDCSMSNYLVLNKGNNYYNIETEKGDVKTQRKMIDKLMNSIK